MYSGDNNTSFVRIKEALEKVKPISFFVEVERVHFGIVESMEEQFIEDLGELKEKKSMMMMNREMIKSDGLREDLSGVFLR
jgi:hypothetical protein